MKFEDFIEQGKVRRGSPDIPKVKSLLETSKNHLLFLENQEINEIKVYSHEAFTYFLIVKE